MTNVEKIDKIIKTYNKKYMFILNDDKQSFALSGNGIIILHLDKWRKPNTFFIFSVLHEIGHCETYQDKQTTVMREYLATQWAIDHSKEWDVHLSKQNQKDWQEYVYSYTKAKDKSKYQLKW